MPALVVKQFFSMRQTRPAQSFNLETLSPINSFLATLYSISRNNNKTQRKLFYRRDLLTERKKSLFP